DGRGRARDDRRDPTSVRAFEFLANRVQLALHELADQDAAPAVGGSDDGRVHELQDRPLAERMRDDLGPALLVADQPLEPIRDADDTAMPKRKPGVRDARRRSDLRHTRRPAETMAHDPR